MENKNPFGRVITDSKITKNIELLVKEIFNRENNQLLEVNKLLDQGYIITSFHCYHSDKEKGIIHINLNQEKREDIG